MKVKAQVRKAYGILRNATKNHLIPDVETVQAISGDAWKSAMLAFAVRNAPVGEKNAPFFSRYRYRVVKVLGHKRFSHLTSVYLSSKSK